MKHGASIDSGECVPAPSVVSADSPRRRRCKHGSLPLDEQLVKFRDFGRDTRVLETWDEKLSGKGIFVPTYLNKFWTAGQLGISSLHEISCRCCKPQLHRFFIKRLTDPGETVYDPFMGLGTTPLEAALLGRVPYGCDINPLSVCLTQPRLAPPDLSDVDRRLRQINFATAGLSQKPTIHIGTSAK